MNKWRTEVHIIEILTKLHTKKNPKDTQMCQDMHNLQQYIRIM